MKGSKGFIISEQGEVELINEDSHFQKRGIVQVHSFGVIISMKSEYLYTSGWVAKCKRRTFGGSLVQ